jgi:hypothetical protein
MIPSPLRLLFATGSALVLTVLASAAELEIIAKARARIGSEAAINGVKSIHYVGTMVTADPADPTKQTRAAIDIVFQKNDLQRIRGVSDKIIETTGLDGYEAWQRKQDAADALNYRQMVLGLDTVKRLRANTWETLAFFRGIEGRGGRVEDLGSTTIDGIACRKVAFIHAPNIVFTRYFDLATGRLVFTETENGGTLREQGEIIEAGLKFPKTLITTNQVKEQNGPNKGKEYTQTVTINVEKVTVNEVFAPEFFAVPYASMRPVPDPQAAGTSAPNKK